MYPMSIVFPLQLARIADLEVPVPANVAAYGTLDAQGEYNGAGGFKGRPGHGGDYRCLLHNKAGCGPAELVHTAVSHMRELARCGYANRMSLVDKLQPPLGPDVKFESATRGAKPTCRTAKAVE